MKMLVVGDSGVGKSSLIKRYVYGKFSGSSRPTIGVDFAVKVFNYDANTTVRIQLWDIAGQERYGHMTRVYYKESKGALLLFDTNSESSFQNVVKWKQDIDSKVFLKQSNDPIPVVVLANKFDLFKMDGFYADLRPKMDDYCKENGFIGWTETSAKNEELVENIDKGVRLLIDYAMLKGEFGPSSDPATRKGSSDNILTGSMLQVDLNDEKKVKKQCKGGCKN
jgi:small GTP-binding protein